MDEVAGAGLNSRLPLDMIVTRVESSAVIDLIGQLEHGQRLQEKPEIVGLIILQWLSECHIPRSSFSLHSSRFSGNRSNGNA